jgi:hypothetical protein
MADESKRSLWYGIKETWFYLPISLCLVIAVSPIMALSDFMADKNGPIYRPQSWGLPVGIIGTFLVLLVVVGQLKYRIDRLEIELKLLREQKPKKDA